jgi:hypothetical protein
MRALKNKTKTTPTTPAKRAHTEGTPPVAVMTPEEAHEARMNALLFDANEPDQQTRMLGLKFDQLNIEACYCEHHKGDDIPDRCKACFHELCTKCQTSAFESVPCCTECPIMSDITVGGAEFINWRCKTCEKAIFASTLPFCDKCQGKRCDACRECINAATACEDNIRTVFSREIMTHLVYCLTICASSEEQMGREHPREWTEELASRTWRDGEGVKHNWDPECNITIWNCMWRPAGRVSNGDIHEETTIILDLKNGRALSLFSGFIKVNLCLLDCVFIH